ncbi:hypothetical protein BGZ99_010444 [Dissophora globulifera]|uniref:Multicopper oxidase n=1 Tax=Dissophora globulifera TaxID=979702 RepID=A0A9P6UM42_9FUNG|nr:hypothetical protein BGZ99_010444 [Dissophora globulifera]
MRRISAKRVVLALIVSLLIVIVLAVVAPAVASQGINFQLPRRQSSSSTPSASINSTRQAWNDPSQFILGKNNFVITATPTTRYYDWTISQQDIAPDGLQRSMLLVNGMFPGPLIEANTGDRIVVKVSNNLAIATALHWHGMFQNGTNWMDGSTGVTQCPIPPGGTFTYNFTIPSQWGTYWWHAHAVSQYVDGVVGPLIIHSPDEPHLAEYDEDLIVMLSDYHHTPSKPLVSWYLSTESDGIEPTPDNGLINGRNSFNCSNDALAQFPTNAKCISNAPRTVFDFKAGVKYRIRLINSGAFAEFQFSIDSHSLTVIEADGVDMQPVQIQRIPIHIGQRYSVIVQADQAIGNYWVRAIMNTYCVGGSDNPALNLTTTAIVHYAGASLVNPSAPHANSQDWGSDPWPGRCLDLTSDMLKPYDVQDAPPADVQFILHMSAQKITEDHVRFNYVNTTSWVPLKSAATLFEAHQGATTFAASQMVITLNKTQTVELIINRSGAGSYVPGESVFNTVNPVRRDTATLQTFGHTVLRFVNDNPGMWAFHCHIDWHMQAGLMLQFLSLPATVQSFKIPEELKAMCNA